MKRRRFIQALGALSATSLISCAAKENNTEGEQQDTQQANITQQKVQWKLVTSWPKNFPGLGMGPENLANRVAAMTAGKFNIQVYGAGEIVPALEVFDTVSQGAVQMGHSSAYYWKGKFPVAPFFTSVPFGLTAQEMNAWLHYGGGLELWRELYAPFNLIPFAGGNTGVQMGGWFNQEINSLQDLRGLKMRIPGIAGEVWRRVGGVPVTLPGGELYTALQTGVIDATEWVGPYNDLAFGLHKIAKYYYSPGWHEPGPALEFTVNRNAFDKLPKAYQEVLASACRVINQDMLDEYTARNNTALQQLLAEHKVQLKKFPNDVLVRLHKISQQVLADVGKQNELSQRIVESYQKFQSHVQSYHNLSERAYLNARELT